MKKLLSVFAITFLISACTLSESALQNENWKRVSSTESCNCSLEVPQDWSDDIGVYENAAIEVAGSNVQVAVFTSPKGNSSGQFNLDQHAETVLENLKKISPKYTENTRRRMKIDGKNTLQFRIERTDTNGNSSVEILTFIEGPSVYYELLGWSFPDSYPQKKDLISRVIKSFKTGSL